MALNKDRIFKAADKHIRNNKIEKAINEYETWLKENRKDWNTIRIVGDLYARIGRNDEAIKKYAQVADNYRRDGFNVRAIATHKMILRLDPQNESAMRNLAELQAEEGLLMEAKSHFQTLVEIYNKGGQKRRAAEVFKKLAEIDPQDVKIRYKYAEFLNKQGKPDEASREYVGIADQFIGQGLVEEAVKILEQGRSLGTSDPGLKIKLAQAHALQGNHTQAVQLLEEVRNSRGGDPRVLAQLGEAYLAAGNTAEAESALQELNRLEPGKPENLIRLVDLRVAQSKLDEAIGELTALVDKYVADGQGAKAAELLQKILGKDPYHVKTLLKLAEVHTILKQDSGRIAAYDSLCEAYSRAGDHEKAVQVAEQLVELDSEGSQHKDRLKFLKSKLAAPQAAPPTPTPPPEAPEAGPPSSPRVQADRDVPGLGDVAEIDLGDAVSAGFESELALDEPAPASESAASPAAVDLGEVVELTQEDEENIKEKLTEAEVFVRYGLVDKAIAQLVDVLESFRFHTESREKLIEIYRDQGMNREAADQLVQLSQAYEKLGQPDEAKRARDEATELNPALAAQVASAELAAQEELELTLAPETESDLGDVGIEVGSPVVSDDLLASPSPPSAPEPTAEAEDEIPVSFEDSFAAELPAVEEPEIEISLEPEAPPAPPPTAAADDVAAEIDLGASSPEMDVEEIPVSVEDSLPDLEAAGDAEEVSVDLDVGAESPPGVSLSGGEDEDIEIDLDAAAEGVSFSVEEPADETLPAEPEGSGGGLSVSEPVASAESAGEALEEEFSVEIEDEEEDIAVEIPSEVAETAEPVVSRDLDAASEEAADDIEIDIPAIDDAGEEEIDIPLAAEPEPTPSPPAPEPEPEPPAPEPAPPPASEPVVEIPIAVPSPPPGAQARPEPESPLAAELAEVDEYVALGLYEDAQDTLRELLKQHPGAEEITAKIQELGFSVEQVRAEPAESARLVSRPAPPVEPTPPAPESPTPEAPPPAAAASPPEEEPLSLEALVDAPEPEPAMAAAAPASGQEEFIDLASELSDEIFGTQSAVDEEEEFEGPLTDPGLDQIFREFRKGVEKQLGTEDYDTRYNLGIAYKEMGLLDEAIAEFQLAAKDAIRGLECCSMLGLCFMEKGMPDIAIKWFSKGLEMPGRRDEEYHGLRYDLAQACEAANQPERALQLYMDIYNENARFRDVKDRVRDLQATLG